MVELEKIYLAKSLPPGLKSGKSKEIIDIYIPKESDHPTLRIRKYGERYEITKKQSVASYQVEQVIKLNEVEFKTLAHLGGKRTRKMRYYYPYEGYIAEIDVFQDDLAGLVIIDFVFEAPDEKANFTMPDFCLAEVTEEVFLDGGRLAGKMYPEIKKELDRFEYKALTLA